VKEVLHYKVFYFVTLQCPLGFFFGFVLFS